MIINREFPANYDVEVIAESPQPARLPHYYFPGGSLRGGRDGVLIRVKARNAEPWIGTFAFGTNGDAAGVFTTADPDRFMVISSGAAYYVCASNPAATMDVQVCNRVLDVRLAPARGLVLLADDIYITAYGACGFAWRTERLCLDGFAIDVVTESVIRGTCGPSYVECGPFEVELTTGRHTGGLPRSWSRSNSVGDFARELKLKLQHFIQRLTTRS